jgi:predicted DsbA family dithiol-disulfide isomerase
MRTAGTTQHVEIILDTACGWSYLGYTRFARAAARHRANGGRIEVIFRPFQLDPAATTTGEPLLEVLRHKFGGNVDEDNARFTETAAQDGLKINYDRALHANTFEAHRLIATAARQGLAEPMVERLFRAHYTDGLNVGDAHTLAKLAAEVGVTTSDSGADALRTEIATVRRRGITGIPVFVFEDGSVLTGGLSEEVLFRALQRVVTR